MAGLLAPERIRQLDLQVGSQSEPILKKKKKKKKKSRYGSTRRVSG
jgi:hypothetical protein